MASAPQKYARRSERTSYVSTVIGIALVLFMLGLVGWLVLSARKVTRLAKESIRIDVFFKENTRDADMRQLEKVLASEDFVKSARFVSKEEALEVAREILGDEDPTAPIDNYNPILPSVEVYIKEDHAQLDSVMKIEENLMMQHSQIIQEISYDRSMFQKINENARSLIFIILGLAALLLVVAIALINNTIRLAVFSKRFLIRSMQLVGATERFIRKPFMWKAFFQGIIAALIALGMILSVMNYAGTVIPDFDEIQDLPMMLYLFGAITLLGILISWISTYFALRKYLRIKSDYLY